MRIAIDVSNIYHRAYAVVSGYENFNIQRKKYQIMLFKKFMTDITSIVRNIRQNADDTVILCFDSKHYFRTNIDNKYKGNRAKKTQEFYDIINYIFTILNRHNLNAVKIDLLEADDLLCLSSNIDEEFTVLVSNDADIRQLVNENVVVYTANSLNNKVYCSDLNVVKNKLPKYYKIAEKIDVDYLKLEKLLLGDIGDNVSRIIRKGIGSSKIKKLYETMKGFSDIENHLENPYFSIDFDEYKKQLKLVILNRDYMPKSAVKIFDNIRFTKNFPMYAEELIKDTKYDASF